MSPATAMSSSGAKSVAEARALLNRRGQTDPAIEDPMAPPIELQRERMAMAIPRCLCGTDACAATLDATIDQEFPTVMRNLPKNRQTVLWFCPSVE